VALSNYSMTGPPSNIPSNATKLPLAARIVPLSAKSPPGLIELSRYSSVFGPAICCLELNSTLYHARRAIGFMKTETQDHPYGKAVAKLLEEFANREMLADALKGRQQF